MEDEDVGCFLLTAVALDGATAVVLVSFLFLLLLLSAAAAVIADDAITGRVTVVDVVAVFLLDSNAAASRARKLSVF